MKTALVRWVGEDHLAGEGGSGNRVEMDGDGVAGFSPSELVAVALGGCTALDVVSILRKKRQDVSSYEIAVEAQQREDHPRAFTEVVVEHRVSGEALDPEAVRRSIELSASRYCTVTAIVASGIARIAHRYVVTDATGEHRGDVLVTGPDGAGIPALAASARR
jgi:putative redox protein